MLHNKPYRNPEWSPYYKAVGSTTSPTSAAKPVPYAMPCILLEFVGAAERGTMSSGQHKVSVHSCPVPRPGEVTPGSPRGEITTQQTAKLYEF